MASRRVKPVPPAKPKRLAGRKITRFSDLPIEVLTENLLPQMGLQEARRFLLADPQVLPFLPSSDQCKYLTEEKALCHKKKVFNIPRVGEIDCIDYCGCPFSGLFEYVHSHRRTIKGFLTILEENVHNFEGTDFGFALFTTKESIVGKKGFLYLNDTETKNRAKISPDRANDWCLEQMRNHEQLFLHLEFYPLKLPPFVQFGPSDLVLYTPEDVPFLTVRFKNTAIRKGLLYTLIEGELEM